MRLSKLLAAASLLAFTAAAAATAQEQQFRDLTVEQANTAQVAAPHAGSLKTVIASDRADNTYAVGETVRLQITTNEDAYVTVLDIGPSGQATQLFPNKYQQDNHVLANRPVEIAGGATGAKIQVAPPTGTEFIKVITSNKPIVVIPESQLQGSGAFHTIDGGAKALVRDLQVVADAPPSADTSIAFNNFALYTVPTRSASAPQTIVVIPAQPTPTMPMVHVPVPADQPFPLLLAADKSNYKVGDKATIAVTTTQACNLTVLEFTTSGQVRTLFPNASTPNPALGAMQTVFVSGGASANLLQITDPPGTEQLLAVCATTDSVATTPDKDAASAARDLAVVAAHGGTAMASVLFGIQP